jgi:hypothetical protein
MAKDRLDVRPGHDQPRPLQRPGPRARPGRLLRRGRHPAQRDEPMRAGAVLAGAVAGLDLVYLPCHIGRDRLSWARLGARVSGVDFSPVAIARARELAAGARTEGGSCRPTCSPCRVSSAAAWIWPRPPMGGALCWIGDLDRWAGSAASTLRRGGGLVVVDLHPVYNRVDWLHRTRRAVRCRGGPAVLSTTLDPTPTRRPISVRPPRRSGRSGWMRWSPLWPGPGSAWTGWSSTCRPRSTIWACSCREDGRWPLTVDGRDVPLLSALEGSKAAG